MADNSKITKKQLNAAMTKVKEYTDGLNGQITTTIGNDTLSTKNKTLIGAINEIFKELTNVIAIINGTTVKVNSVHQLKNNWKFKLISSTSNKGYNSTSESEKTFDDSSWNSVTVPHDWSIYNDFNSSSPSSYDGGFLDGGDAWYRIKLNTSKLKGKKVFVYFDGVYMESDVYINGTKVKTNKWYNPFTIELSEHLNYDDADVLSVFVRNQQPSSRWYSGSGIIRNVYLMSADEVSIGLGNIHVTTPNLETEKDADVTTNIKIVINNSNLKTDTIKIKNTILYNNQEKVTNTIDKVLSGSDTEEITTTLKINRPELWDIYQGNLYTLKTQLLNSNDEVIHECSTKFGYRYFKFDKDTGFSLNGKNVKIKGVCMHHDLGCIGAEVNASAIERQINSLIEMGANAIRITHNPSSTEMLNICAEKGILVVEEFFDCWTSFKTSYDFARYYKTYSDEVIKTTVNRDKNNPAIIMWSVGNEIIRTLKGMTSEAVVQLVDNMMSIIRGIDTERPVTMGDDTPDNSISRECMKKLDVIGVNYGNDSEYSNLRSAISDKPIYGSETTSALSSRGVYARDNVNYQCSSFDDDKVNWGDYAAVALKRHMDSSYLVGMFIWTGYDYIGEPTPFNKYPTKSSYFGIYDTCGFPKDIKYMYQSRWTTAPMIHILPHWDWTDGNKKVWLYSNCDKVELFLNGTSLGAKTKDQIGTKYEFEYTVPYQKGTLVANGYDSGNNVIAQDIVYTSLGTATTTKLYSDKSSVNVNSDDLVFITCDIVDRNGVIIPNANNEITFTVEGGTVIGTDNGNAACVEKYRSNKKSAFNGKVLCVVKPNNSTGDMTITASGSGLVQKTITVSKGEKTVLNTKQTSAFIDATNPTIYDYAPESIACTGISLNKNILTLNATVSNSTQLTATVTPDNCTQPVVWSVNPTGIVTVSNGLVTAIANGTATITATCGTQSATCNVTVSGVNSGEEPTSLLYELPQETTFNGTSDYIDTGVALLSTDQNYTILMDFTPSKTQNRQATIFHCMHEASPYYGISMQINNPKIEIPIGNNKNSFLVSDMFQESTTRQKIAIVRNGNIINLFAFNGKKESTYTHNNVTENLLLGAYQTADGTKGRYFTGTIHECKVYTEALSDSNIDGFIHPGINYELNKETVFNGTDTYIDTCIPLIYEPNVNKDFTILLDFTLNSIPTSEMNILHCMNEISGLPGISLDINNGNFRAILPNNNSNNLCAATTNRIQFIITKSGNTFTVYNSDMTSLATTTTDSIVVTNKTLLIGAYQDSYGTKGKFMNGAIHRFKITEGVMSNEDCLAWLSIGKADIH